MINLMVISAISTFNVTYDTTRTIQQKVLLTFDNS